MTTLVTETAKPKPLRESDTALNARSRLMMSGAEQSESLTARLLVAQQSNPEDVETKQSDLLLQGLVDRLPKPNAKWSLDDRAKWLRTAASIFDLVYKSADGERGEISVTFAKRDL